MSDYIKREGAINEIKRFGGYIDDDMIYRINTALNRIPSADVVSRKDYESMEHTVAVLNAEIMSNIMSRVKVLTAPNPFVDIVKARHAEWQLTHRDKDFYKDVYQCSECRFLVTGAQEAAYVYCPNCGARMDGENE